MPDDCVCACSSGGCEAFALIIKCCKSAVWNSSFQQLADLWAGVKDICVPLKSSDFLRLLTFQELGLTHTCCRIDRDRGDRNILVSRIRDQAKIEEIQHADLQKLEELLQEFEAKRVGPDPAFSNLLEEYWRT